MLRKTQKLQNTLLIQKLRQISFVFRSLVSREPYLKFLYYPYLWWGQIKRRNENISQASEGLLLPDTEIVIDGFQGSANSFATAIFKKNQARHVKITHHRHAPIIIIEAVKLGIPVVITIREPEKAVISLTRRWPHISVVRALKSYIGFYSKLEPYADRCVISTFELTTQHFDRVIEKVNTKYNTKFDLVDMAIANLERHKKISKKTEEVKDIRRRKMEELANLEGSSLLLTAQHIYNVYEDISRQEIEL